MTRYILHIEYDGTAYAGFQLQPEDPTIQGRLEQALEKIYKLPVRIHGSGRTDAGVHAHGQIVHFDAPAELQNFNLKAALNSGLPRDIRVLRYAEADEGFHARFSARERFYTYRICRRDTAIDRLYTWQIRQDLNIKTMRECAAVLPGEHDFTAFCSAQAEVDHKRCIILDARWTETGDELQFHISANRFLHNMVRSLTGTIVEAGKGRFGPEDFKRILLSCDRNSGAVTAPPQGLSLIKVAYEKPIGWVKEK